MNSSNKAVLLILDGWGINQSPKESAIASVNPKYFGKLLEAYPHSRLEACGSEVGLPKGVMGNSEVGHENIGAGRISKQKLTLISESIDNGSFFHNPELLRLTRRIKSNGGRLHIVGLLSEGDVHSHLGHMYALISQAEQEFENYFVHPILDGRDDPPRNCIPLLEKLAARLNRGQIGSICGRYWAMDRDNNWNRIQKYWDLLIKNQGLKSANAIAGVQEAYNRASGIYSPAEQSDEFIQPTCFEGIDSRIKDGDGVLFFNYRPDRARQISIALTQNDFQGFKRDLFPKIEYLCLTYYDRALHEASDGANPVIPVAFTEESFPAQDKTNSLGEYIANLKLSQLRIAETEKFRHVTSFFNQGLEDSFAGEERILIPSPKVATYDQKPEMSVFGIADGMVKAINEGNFNLIVANFANADMVGHTGVFEATKQAIEFVDQAIEKVVETCKQNRIPILITADHGNADQMINPDGSIRTAHSLNPVPCILASDQHKGIKLTNGALCDIASTILNLMNLTKPKEMSGKSLF